MFPATTRTFTKDTALSEQGRGAARARHAMCESAFIVITLEGKTLIRQ